MFDFSKLNRVLAVTFFACSLTGSALAVPLPEPLLDTTLESQTGSKSIVVAGGCFWGVQAVFQHLKGVISAQSGYAGGDAITAHYEIVSTGATGHAESVKVVYDPSKITLGKILQVYFSVAHNPTELNYQGPDHGTQYRSAIFTSDPEQKNIVVAYIDQLNKTAVFDKTIATKIEPLAMFYPAEDYHQDYARLHPENPYIATFDLPKLRDMKTLYPSLYVEK